MNEKQATNNSDFRRFLIKAKRNTYASIGESGEKILKDGGRELVYAENKYKYRDRYFGFNSFVGEEIVWKNGQLVWAMNYYGGIASIDISVKKTYEFLQKALRHIQKDEPFRGPNEFSRGQFYYTNRNNGTVNKFIGEENIFYQKKKVYELKYHGGKVAGKMSYEEAKKFVVEGDKK